MAVLLDMRADASNGELGCLDADCIRRTVKPLARASSMRSSLKGCKNRLRHKVPAPGATVWLPPSPGPTPSPS
jgi:hypothetical protein